VTTSDLPDILKIDSPNGYKNFVEELFPNWIFFDPHGNFDSFVEKNTFSIKGAANFVD
jgi:hypothetical protein